MCSKVYGKLSDDLAEEVATCAKRLCSEKIPFGHLEFLLSCRLVALKKEDDGVRPVGIGETLRRIIGKSLSKIAKKDIEIAGGSLQTCTGVEAGSEAAIHAMSNKWNEPGCEAAILVDADNAFNQLNRKVALHNIQQLCPIIYQFLANSYSEPTTLYLGNGQTLLSQEGATQGDNLAMAMYAVSTRPLIDDLAEAVPEMFQVWFADDSSGAGKLVDLKKWWDQLKRVGPLYGYHPKPSKCHVIVKTQEDYDKAQQIFYGEGVTITLQGKRHIGAALGSEQFKIEYVAGKVSTWVKDVEELAEIAKEEPQAALSAFNIGMSQRWNFLQRTIKCSGELFSPLEEAIRKLINSLLGREVNELERRLIALPYRHGGLGIRNPSCSNHLVYETSVAVTHELADLILAQDMDLSKLDQTKVKDAKNEMKLKQEKMYAKESKALCLQLDERTKKLIEGAKQKGASSWLSSLPMKKLGYTLNKQEFRDSVSLRYGWQLEDVPDYCGCGDPNDFDHIFTCKKGGYVTMRHNDLRDAEARLLKQVCRDVKVEPGLLPTDQDFTGNVAEEARSDISVRGLWSSYQKTFMDVRVSHPTSNSNMRKTLEQICREQEQEKKVE